MIWFLRGLTWFVVLTVPCVLLYPGVVHEFQRWEECLVVCQVRFDNNERVLNNEMCSNPFVRAEHGKNADDMCNKAWDENLATPKRCAWKKFWIEGEVYALYAQVAHSQLMLYGMLTPALLFIIYMVFSVYKSQKKEDRKEREQQRMLEAFKDVAKSMSGSQLVPFQNQQQQQQHLALPMVDSQQMVFLEPTLELSVIPRRNPRRRGLSRLNSRPRSKSRKVSCISDMERTVTIL